MRDLTDADATIVTRLPAGGMVTLRGALDDAAFAEALDTCGVAVPDRRRVAECPAGTALWMSPDEILVLCDPGADAALAARLPEALEAHHHLALAVGDARARFAIAGPGARLTLAKLSPVDMRTFPRDEVRRTRLAQVPAAFWMTGEEVFELVCFRSVAEYANTALCHAARHVDDLTLP